MFDRIRNIIFSYRLSKQPRPEAAFPCYDKVQTVLVLFQSDLQEKNADVLAFRDTLLRDGKDVVLLGYAEKKDILSLVLPQRRIMGWRDIRFIGAPRQEVIDDLLKREYDLLIDLSQQPCLPLRYCALYARARFKTGMSHGEGLYHLMVNTPAQDSVTYLGEQILHYLKSIHSNDLT